MSAYIHHFPKPENPTKEQREYFHEQASYWDGVIEMAERQLDYATEQRDHALRMLGMVKTVGSIGIKGTDLRSES